MHRTEIAGPRSPLFCASEGNSKGISEFGWHHEARNCSRPKVRDGSIFLYVGIAGGKLTDMRTPKAVPQGKPFGQCKSAIAI